jgi:hypothetical protein
VAPAEELSAELLAWAGEVLRLNGVRHFFIDGRPVNGIWSDLDGPHIREALRILGDQDIPVRYLDGPGIPMRYKVRTMKGQPVPLDIVKAMESSSKPWATRDRMLAAIDWHCKVHVYIPAKLEGI